MIYLSYHPDPVVGENTQNVTTNNNGLVTTIGNNGKARLRPQVNVIKI